MRCPITPFSGNLSEAAVLMSDPGKGMGAAGIFGYLQIGFAVLK